MKCVACSVERREIEIINHRPNYEGMCYKCVFDKIMESKGAFPRSCRQCGESCPRGRRMFCSPKCAHEGKKIQKRGYWTRQVHVIHLGVQYFNKARPRKKVKEV